MVCLTGVSGSGKSTLVQEVLYRALQKAHGKPGETPGAHRALLGAELIDEAVMIDQTPIGRTTRSNPVSHVGAFDEIRKLFAASADAQLRRYTPGTFSFNSGTGRCPECSGNGFEHVEMQFLSDVYLRCGSCDGSRYRAETLEVRISGATGAQPAYCRSPGPDRGAGRGVLRARAARCWRGCNHWPRWAWITCAWASRCPHCPAARRSG